MAETDKSDVPVVELRNARKIYRMGDEDVNALDGVSLQIRAGEFIAILGPSGSGKSTMMHMLGFMDTLTSGRLIFEGRDVTHVGASRRAWYRANRIGFIFQAFQQRIGFEAFGFEVLTDGIVFGLEAVVLPQHAGHTIRERIAFLRENSIHLAHLREVHDRKSGQNQSQNYYHDFKTLDRFLLRVFLRVIGITPVIIVAGIVIVIVVFHTSVGFSLAQR